MKILVVGDFVPLGRVDKFIEKGEYQNVFGEVQPLTAGVDYSIVNFESPVVLDESTIPIEKNGPNLKCSSKAIDAIKWAGFDMVTLANNHFLDYGETGVDNTMKICRDKGLDTVGGGKNLHESQKVFYKEIEGQVLAVINCCEHEFSIATSTSAGANPLDPIQQYYQIREAREKADYVLVIVHGGHEYYQLPSPRMVEIYRFFIDIGADVVINHHQHCYSGYEKYHGKLIFYGLGNFCFDKGGNWNHVWNEGFMVELRFVENEISYKLYPYVQGKDVAGVKMMNRDDEKRFQNQLSVFNNIIKDKNLLSKSFEDFVISRKKGMLLNFYPLFNRYARALYNRGLLPTCFGKKKTLAIRNMVECESHRDVLLDVLKLGHN